MAKQFDCLLEPKEALALLISVVHKYDVRVLRGDSDTTNKMIKLEDIALDTTSADYYHFVLTDPGAVPSMLINDKYYFRTNISVFLGQICGNRLHTTHIGLNTDNLENELRPSKVETQVFHAIKRAFNSRLIEGVVGYFEYSPEKRSQYPSLRYSSAALSFLRSGGKWVDFMSHCIYEPINASAIGAF